MQLRFVTVVPKRLNSASLLIVNVWRL